MIGMFLCVCTHMCMHVHSITPYTPDCVPYRAACPHKHTHAHRSAISHLDDSVVNGSVLLLPQHHQGDDDHGCYDDTSDHQADNGALVGAHILSEEDLREARDRQWSGDLSAT